MTRKLTFSLADTKHGKVPPYLDKYRQKWYDQIYKIENLWGGYHEKVNSSNSFTHFSILYFCVWQCR